VGLGAVVSVVLHVVVLALVVWFSSRPPRKEAAERVVTLQQTLEPLRVAPAPPPPPPAHQQTRARRLVTKKPHVRLPPRQHPQDRPPEVESAPAVSEAEEAAASTEEEEGADDGEIGGVVGGVVGGVLGGQVGGTGTDVHAFDEGMTRPRKLSGPKPRYTREALAARVQGLMIVRCVITTEGRIERCRIIKPQPHMERAVLEALYASRYQPVTLHGRPIQVDYTFNIRLSLPD
jgi:protein TonB